MFNHWHTFRITSHLPGIILGCSALSTLAYGNNTIDFNRDILPILSEKCFACHGPDSATRKKDLRLDIQSGLFGKSEFGQPLIIPSDPEESEIYYRITSEDIKERMPPSDFHLKLSKNEIDIIKNWIDQGAPWQGHWAFKAPQKSALPSVSDTSWPKNDIDYFILHTLENAGMSPSTEADKESLIRRVSLDLTGLPPTLDEMDAFMSDRSPQAYEKVVDRLLASPHYGERMAFPWLNIARYSDTNGYQRDTIRTMWPWRDWVINAFNDNMPFDQFTIEQLAGDLLPDATLSQKIATGFNRNHRINGEGGIIPEEYAVEYVVDRVSTTSTAWMGLTMECARCHDHKFDPVSQKEFYEMYAFFNRVPEEGKGRERGNDRPFIQVPTSDDLEFKTTMNARIAELKAELYSPNHRLDSLQQEQEAHLSKLFTDLNWQKLKPINVSAANGTTLTIQDDQSVFASGPTPDEEQYSITFKTSTPIRSIKLDLLMDDRLVLSGPGRNDTGNMVLTDIKAIRNPAESNNTDSLKFTHAYSDVARIGTDYEIKNAIDDDPKSGWSIGTHLERKNRAAIFVLDEKSTIQPGDTITITLKHESELLKSNAGRFSISATASSDISNWVKPALGSWQYLGPIQGTGSARDLLDQPMPPEEGFNPQFVSAKEKREWQTKPNWKDGSVISLGPGSRTIHYLHRTIDTTIPSYFTLSFGSGDAIKVWIDGTLHLTKNERRDAAPDQDSIPIYLSQGRHEMMIKIVNYQGDSAYYFQAQDNGGEHVLKLMAQLTKPTHERTESEITELKRMFRMQDPQWFEKSLNVPKLESELSDYESRITTTMVMEDKPTPQDTYLLKRGVYDQPDTSENLQPSVPALLNEMDESFPKNRLGLAQWLVNPGHPLTARVRVNHYWQMYFGQGIVKTSEDFGTQSTAPSHPELLDYLAVDFIESGWDVKAMQKKIVMSSTYRQKSVVTKEHLDKDPENILLGRAPRFRLSGEMIRDQALYVSGLMNMEIGGPSVYPYQPDKMWSSLSFQNMDEFDTNFYKPDNGEKLYRRGLYTYWKRTIAPPRMQIFDAPDREQCSMRQDETNTPMQAMVLLNDPTFVQAARHLAERIIHEAGKSKKDRVQYGYKLALASEPDSEQQELLIKAVENYRKHFKKRKIDAKEFLSVGDSDYDHSLKVDELAAYTMLASVILNLDKTITRE